MSLYERTELSSVVFPRTDFTIRVTQSIENHFDRMRIDLKSAIEQLTTMYRGNLIVNAFSADWTLEYGNASNGYLLRNVPRLFANGSR